VRSGSRATLVPAIFELTTYLVTSMIGSSRASREFLQEGVISVDRACGQAMLTIYAPETFSVRVMQAHLKCPNVFERDVLPQRRLVPTSAMESERNAAQAANVEMSTTS